MKNQGRVILGLVLVLFIVLFAVFNVAPVPVSFGFTAFEAPLIVIIIGSAIIGALIVFLTASTTWWQQKKKVKDLTSQIKELQDNIDEKVAKEKEKLLRNQANQLAELEAKYQTEINEKERIILESTTNASSADTRQESSSMKKENNVDYFG